MSEESSNIEIISPNTQINLEDVQNNNSYNKDETNKDETNIENNLYDTSNNKFQLIYEIENYESGRFGERILKKYPDIFLNLTKLTEEQLKQRLHVLEIFLKHRGTNKTVETYWLGFCMIYEKVTKKIGFQTNGFATMLGTNDECLDLAEELRLKYFSTTKLVPEYQLLTVLLQYTSTIHELNTKTMPYFNESINNSEEIKKLLL